jgi:anaerobic ribonucleoside-triphosphate reductase activating protein
MNYAKIKNFDVSNGPGVRVSLYVSGCRNHCKNCFNPETWDFCYGEPFTKEIEDKIIEYLKPDFIKGMTVLGGDPFEPENAVALAPFIERVRATYPDKSIWCFTGYDFSNDVIKFKRVDKDTTMRILSCLDVLVDGRFVEEKKDLNLLFRGSSNQRIILMKPTLQSGEVTLWDEKTVV